MRAFKWLAVIFSIPVILMIIVWFTMPGLRWSLYRLVWIEYDQIRIASASGGDELMTLEEAENKLAEDPQDIEAWTAKAERLKDVDREASLAAYDSAIKLDPGNKVLHFNKCFMISMVGRRGEPEWAEQRLIEHTEKYPDSDIAWSQLYLFYTALNRKEYDKALWAAENGLRVNPESWVNYTARGNSLYGVGRFEESVESYRKALDLLGHPGAFTLNYDDVLSYSFYKVNMAKSLIMLERDEEALEVCKSSLTYNSHGEWAAYPMMSYAYAGMGKYEEALSYVGGSPFSYQSDPEVLRAYILIKRSGHGDAELAKDILDKYLSDETKEEEDDYVYALALAGRREEALDIIRANCAERPYLKRVYMHTPELEFICDDPEFQAIVGEG